MDASAPSFQTSLRGDHTADEVAGPTADAGADDHSDAALLRAYLNGDAAAFSRLYDRHEQRIHRFLLRALGDRALAEEVHQETWLAVVRHAADWTPRARFSTWLFSIAHHKLVDHWRARDPASEAYRFDPPPPAHETDDQAQSRAQRWLEHVAAHPHEQPEHQTQARAQARALADAVTALPPSQREVFLLHTDGGLSIDAVADVVGAPAETVKSRFRYALARLRVAMEHWR